MRRSASPLIVFVLGSAAALVLAMYTAFAPAGEATRLSVTAVGSSAILAMCAVVVLAVALSFGRREPWRRQWLLVGLGIAAYALGRVVYALDVAYGSPILWLPSSDALVLAQYVLIAAALVAVAQSYRSVTDARRPALVVIVAGAACLAALWFGLVEPFVLPQSSGPVQALRMALYPAADILFLVVPAAFVALTLAQLGGVRFARPWYFVSAGAAVLALSDSAIIWLSARGSYIPGTVVDYGAIIAELLFAAGALAAARLAEEFMPTRSPAV